MPSATTTFLLLFVLFAFCLSGNGVYAFGAGNIPSFAYMEGKAFRHGDIEDILAELIKRGASGGFSLLSKGSKFNGLDIKRVYFGNWLRDYSQAVDIASLKKVPLQTILNLCMVLGFLAHGYATSEFEVTSERLGCYLPTEHIDNPKGYGEGEDARKYHPNLRGPVDPRELEIDPRTGMKNYIANENGPWDTSKALVRRTLERCIHLGRQHRSQGRKQDEYEAYRLLGQLMHTLEDFAAHSNFCELALVSMGYQHVFVHVGDSVRIQAPKGKWVAPIVTGTFGSSDFIHSLLGEATDHLSEASVTDLNKELDRAKARSIESSTSRGIGGPTDMVSGLRSMCSSLPGGAGGDISRDMDSIERIRAGPAAGGKRPEDMSPQELHAVLWQVLTVRDSIVKKISKTIEKIPGLGALIEKIQDGISVFVFSTLEPFLKPILKTATASLSAVSGEVIDTHDQYEVFNDPRASDPTHSFLSKDHFNLILNEPAGKVSRAVVQHTVGLVVKAWDNPSENVHAIAEDILQCLFHPDFHNPNSKIQRTMLQTVQEWVQSLGKNQKKILSRLDKKSVRDHLNVRGAGEGGVAAAQGSFAQNEGAGAQHAIAGYAQNIPGAQAVFKATGFGKTKPNKGGREFPPSGAPTSSYGAPDGYPSPAGPPPTSSYPDAHSHSHSHHNPYPPPSGPPHGGHEYQPPQRTGYAPSYTSPPPQSYNAPSEPSIPNFPGSRPAPSEYGFSGYPAPSGPPPLSFPSTREGLGPDVGGGFGFPSTSAPGGPPEPFGGTIGGGEPPFGFPPAQPFGSSTTPYGAPDSSMTPYGTPANPQGGHHHHQQRPPGW